MRRNTNLLTGFIVCIIFLFHFYKASAQQTDKAVPMGIITAFIDSIQATDSVKSNTISSTNGLSDVYEDTAKIFHDSVFKPEDVKYFRFLLVQYRNMQWADSDNLTGIKIIPQSTITSYLINGAKGWDKLSQKCGKGYKSFSFPLFSVDYSYAVMAESYHTRHKTTGGTCLFKNIKGRWKRIKTFSTWSGS